MNSKALDVCSKCPPIWKWGGVKFIIVYVIVGLLFGTSVIMDFQHSKKNEKKNTREEKLSSTFIFLGFIFLFLYQYLNHSKSGLVIVFPLIIISGIVFIYRVKN